jgi:Tfp pilus assembly protein PilP
MGVIALSLAFTMLGAAPQATPQPPAPAPQAQPAKPPSQPAAPAAPAPPPAPPAPPAQTPAPAPAPPPPAETYTYRAEGRRDPFQSLIGSGSGAATSRKGEGPSGMTLAEVSVRGILQSRGALVAMIQGPDNRTYIVHPGDKLLDGTIKTITPTGLIVVQEVNDPLSLVKQREVRKLLRSLEDAKE